MRNLQGHFQSILSIFPAFALTICVGFHQVLYKTNARILTDRKVGPNNTQRTPPCALPPPRQPRPPVAKHRKKNQRDRGKREGGWGGRALAGKAPPVALAGGGPSKNQLEPDPHLAARYATTLNPKAGLKLQR